jgi:hypothetical protein
MEVTNWTAWCTRDVVPTSGKQGLPVTN